MSVKFRYLPSAALLSDTLSVDLAVPYDLGLAEAMRRQQPDPEDPPKPGTMPAMYILSLEEPYKEVKTSCERCSPDAPVSWQ